MKNKLPVFGSLLLLFLLSCSTTVTKKDPENAKNEVAKAEADFARMAADKGIAEAFAYFADSNAVIKRQNDSLIYGKEGIRNYYSKPFFQKATVDWSPDLVEVSSAADLAYTYGKYSWKSPDSNGTIHESKGIFHTVWKKQKDGSWKYVWD